MASPLSLAGHFTRRRFLQGTALLGAIRILPSVVQAEQKAWRVGVIGHTERGNYGHGLDRMWLQVPRTTIAAVADANAAGLSAAAARLPGAVPYADYRDMLSREQPELVAVAPRFVDEHRDMLLAAIRSGARGVYVEKPFCRTSEEADEVVAACARTGCKLAIAHRNRYHPALPRVRELIDAGEIGDVLELRGRGREDHRGGGLDVWVLGSHVFDLARYVAGDAVACSSVIQQGMRPATAADVVEGAEGVGKIVGDRLHARFEMENGLPFYFDSIRNTGVASANFGLQIVGNRGIVDLRVDRNPVAHLMRGNPFEPDATPRTWIPVTSAGIGQPDPGDDANGQVSGHLLAAQDLIAAIQENRPTLCNETDGRAITEMIAAVFASHVAGGQRIPLPLEDRGAPLERTWDKA